MGQEDAKSVMEAVFRDFLDEGYAGDAPGCLPVRVCHAGGGQHKKRCGLLECPPPFRFDMYLRGGRV